MWAGLVEWVELYEVGGTCEVGGAVRGGQSCARWVETDAVYIGSSIPLRATSTALEGDLNSQERSSKGSQQPLHSKNY